MTAEHVGQFRECGKKSQNPDGRWWPWGFEDRFAGMARAVRGTQAEFASWDTDTMSPGNVLSS